MLPMCLFRSYISCRLREKWAWGEEVRPGGRSQPGGRCHLQLAVHLAGLPQAGGEGLEGQGDSWLLLCLTWLVEFQASSMAVAALARWCSTSARSLSLLARASGDRVAAGWMWWQ